MEQQGLHEGSMEKDLISHCKRECKLRRRKEIKKGLCRDKEQAKQQICILSIVKGIKTKFDALLVKNMLITKIHRTTTSIS